MFIPILGPRGHNRFNNQRSIKKASKRKKKGLHNNSYKYNVDVA